MNIVSLKYFIAVAEYSGFTRASERLFVSQPTLSRQVQDLEESLGVRLFVRSKGPLALTAAGARLLDEAKEIVKRCDNLAEVIQREGAEVVGTLNIGYQSFLDTRIMYGMMKALAAEHPGIDFRLSRGNPPELRHNLVFGECDVVFTLRTCVSSMPDVVAHKIADNRLQLAVPASHRLAGQGVVDLKELEGERLIMLEHRVSPLTVDYVTGLCVKHGVSPRFTSYVDNAETALFLVGTGKGITFVHSQMNIDALDDGDAIKILDIEGLDEELDYVLAYRPQSANPLVPLFLSGLSPLNATH